MISKEQYLNAKKIVEQYDQENVLYRIKTGEVFRYKTKIPGKAGVKSRLTVGENYEIVKVKTNYKYSDINIAIYDDNMRLSWYSSYTINGYFEKVK